VPAVCLPPFGSGSRLPEPVRRVPVVVPALLPVLLLFFF